MHDHSTSLHLLMAGLSFINGAFDLCCISSNRSCLFACVSCIALMPLFFQNKRVFARLEILFLCSYTLGMVVDW